MKTLKYLITTVLLAGLTAGCATPQGPSPAGQINQAPVQHPQQIELDSTVQLELPGPHRQPILLSIKKGPLQLMQQSSRYLYYCAAPGQATTDHPTQKNLLQEDECAGIRVDTTTGQQTWVILEHWPSGAIWLIDKED